MIPTNSMRPFTGYLEQVSQSYWFNLNIDVPISRKLSRKGTEVKELEKYRYQVEEKDVMNANKGCSQTGQSRETKG